MRKYFEILEDQTFRAEWRTRGQAMQTPSGATGKTPRVSESDVSRAREKVKSASLEVDRKKRQLEDLQTTINATSLRSRSIESFKLWWIVLLKVRSFCDHSITRIGGMINLFIVVSAVLLVVSSMLGLPLILRTITAAAGALVAGLGGLFLLYPADEFVRVRIVSYQDELQVLTLDRANFETQIWKAKGEFAYLDKKFQRRFNILNALLQDQMSRINQLRGCHWEGMRGIEFESFLVSVFTERGYVVTTTRTTGDQGVDLIVTKFGRKVAIQAKGWPASTVGNGAVQEAYAGMKFYDCESSVVITNSIFTSSAKELARKVNCMLVDGGMIPDLIEGQISVLHPARSVSPF